MTAAIEIVPGSLIFPDLVTGVTAAFPTVSGTGPRWHAQVAVHSVGGGSITIAGTTTHGSAAEARIEGERWAREIAARVLPHRSGVSLVDRDPDEITTRNAVGRPIA